MANLAYQDGTAQTVVIDKNAALTDGSRAAGDYDNSSNGDLYADFFLVVQFDTTAPSAGETIAELYVLHADDSGTPAYPQGGDGTVGSNVDPQRTLMAGVFETRSPSISTDEVLLVSGVPISPRNMRVVIKNVSGQQFDLTWELRMKPYRLQTT